MDADAAWRAVQDFAAPTVAVIKHNTPCGLASNEDLLVAYERAFMADPISAFGGIVAVNRTVDGYLARALRASMSPSSGQRMRYDIVVAPGYTERASQALSSPAQPENPRSAAEARPAVRPPLASVAASRAGARPPAGDATRSS
jgi:phosphoribosylaminoimidazolecarboxamide formyltransferase/IMP cyclohydrolase